VAAHVLDVRVVVVASAPVEPLDRGAALVEQDDLAERCSLLAGRSSSALISSSRAWYWGTTTSRPPSSWVLAIARISGATTPQVRLSSSVQPPTSRCTTSTSRFKVPGCRSA
jgi:hypothetical protein